MSLREKMVRIIQDERPNDSLFNLTAYELVDRILSLQDSGHRLLIGKVGMPTIVCLCGSTRFKEAFTQAQLEETLAGKIVLTIGCNMKSDDEIFGGMAPAVKAAIKEGLDELHMR
ncbi:hypothetical protein LCGC14_2866210, partial [marine sediment metagenome]